MEVKFYLNGSLVTYNVAPGEFLVDTLRNNQTVILNLEGLDPYGIDLYEKATSIFESSDFYLTTPEKEMIDAVKFNFANVIVVMNVGGMVDVSERVLFQLYVQTES